ncbi:MULTISPECIES: tetratricopeptide repeat protein [Corallococcus]|uniref:tetratricopeptide repeat protein n=1 Tax=Corallococcus TaxID=83461 RepID=UPI0011C369B8|nr:MULTISPECIES: tetratricopeptide repeat protein [Corallococcus]NPC72042.1 hypothetical protein [Corallococcus exiguus]NPD22357.1 hypothetical protein [Corallococcus exiguus]
MESLTKPLEKVMEAAEFFMRTSSLRLLYVTTTDLLRIPVLEHVFATESLPENCSAFLLLEAPTESADDGWSLRSDELRMDWQTLLDEAPGGLEPLWPEQASRSTLSRFGLELGRALAGMRAPMTGLVVVLAPVWIKDAERWRQDLTTLLGVRQLERVRFIVVEVDSTHTAEVIEKLGARAERVDAGVDLAALQDETNASLEAQRTAPPGSAGPRRSGAAGPGVTPPPRPHKVAAASAEALAATAAAHGLPTAMLDVDLMQKLKVLVLTAASHMRGGATAEAVRVQREARDFCVAHGLRREAVVNELVLAGYVLQGGSPDRALEVYRGAKARALDADLNELGVQAQLAMGSCLLLLKKTDAAVSAYSEAGQLGARTGASVMAIEAYRMCGQLLLSQGRSKEAATAFQRALGVSTHAGAEVQRASTAKEAAQALAVVCRKHGLRQQAESLEAQALVLEALSTAPPSASPKSK